MIIGLSIPAIQYCVGKGGTCLSGTPLGYVPGLPAAASAALSIPALLSGQFHLALAAANEGFPQRCRLLPVLSVLIAQKFTKQQNAKVFPALQKGVGRRGEHGPHAPSVYLQGLYFLRSLSLSKLCVTK